MVNGRNVRRDAATRRAASPRRSTTAVVAVVAVMGSLAGVTASRAASTTSASRAGDAVAEAVEVALDAVGSPADVGDLGVVDVARSPDIGVTHVYLEQRHDGIGIDGGVMTVNVADGGDVVSAPESLVDDPARLVSGELRLTAVDAAAVAVGARGIGPLGDASIRSDDADPERATMLLAPAVSGEPIAARLRYVAADAALRLAWAVRLVDVTRGQVWRAAVDAETGALLSMAEPAAHGSPPPVTAGRPAPSAVAPEPTLPVATASGTSAASASSTASTPSYRVYAWPLRSPDQGPRTLVVDPADPVASPFGWHDVDGRPGHEYSTARGNNVHAYAQVASIGDLSLGPLADPDQPYQVQPLGEADGGAAMAFDFPADHRAPPPASRQAAITNAFYWGNLLHDVFYGYGFDEQSGNLQWNNYGRGGAGRDPLRMQVQHTSGPPTGGGSFGWTADGTSPVLRVNLAAPLPDVALRDPARAEIRDSAFDADVLVHEYGHGISERLAGGPGPNECVSDNAESGSEGWSDFLALAVTAQSGDPGTDARKYMAYSTQADSNLGAVQPTPYSTDLAVDPATYADLVGRPGESESHFVGYVWASMLWDVYWALVGAHGFNPDVKGDWRSGGNNLAIQLVMDGLRFQVCRPGLVDSRDAILAADRVRTGGANQCRIWAAFARRGLGAGAQQGDSASTRDGAAAFDVPADVGTCDVSTGAREAASTPLDR